MDAIMKAITGIFSGDIASNALKIAAFLVMGIGLWVLGRWLKKQQIKRARRETAEGRARDQAGVVDENERVSRDARKAEKDVRDLLGD